MGTNASHEQDRAPGWERASTPRCVEAEQARVAELDRIGGETAEASRRHALLLEKVRTDAAREQAGAVRAERVRTEAEAAATLAEKQARWEDEAEQTAAGFRQAQTEAVAAALKQAEMKADDVAGLNTDMGLDFRPMDSEVDLGSTTAMVTEHAYSEGLCYRHWKYRRP